MRLLIQHRSLYSYPRPAALGPHTLRLKPATHAKATIEQYGLSLSGGGLLRWQQDPFGNHIARLTFPVGARVQELSITVELVADIHPVNPFDFFLDARCETLPFAYPEEQRRELAPFLDLDDPAYARGERFDEFLAALPAPKGHTISHLVAVNAAIHHRLGYIIREEPGVYTPEALLAAGRGSCRDFAVLLIAVLRAHGLAARFASGYLIQLRDEGLLPDLPRGMAEDVADLHAWAEVFLPGAGWIGLDATSGLLCGEGHIPLASTASPALAAPLEGSSDTPAEEVSFSLKVARLGHEPRPTRPYEDETWERLLAAGDTADAALRAHGLRVTTGGEPTFTSREHPSEPEWNGAALGPSKWEQGKRLAEALRDRLCPGAIPLLRQGKHYPGESLPRWSLDLYWRDEAPLWPALPAVRSGPYTTADAAALAGELAARLGLSGLVQVAYEDAWRFLQDEARLPVEIDPLQAALDDPEARRRLARVLAQGLGRPAGYVLPLARRGAGWGSERWSFRRGHLFLLPGDGPLGLRLPLASLSPGAPVLPVEETLSPRDPRRAPEPAQAGAERRADGEAELAHWSTHALPAQEQPRPAPARAPEGPIRTALCVEARAGEVFVFLPPLAAPGDFLHLVEIVDQARRALRLRVQLEGYAPPKGAGLRSLAVTPDPGVLEVNIPPSESARAHAALLEEVFEAALRAGLQSEKYLLDGRLAGSGGGHHLTIGGPTPAESPFAQRPDLLASLITFVQHHPSLSYLFTGLFVGPTSQAPRVDEARHDALYELEIALARAFHPGENPPPWLGDALFRHLLVDVTGNTHRAEISLDKLFDPQTPTGRQGLVELRAFEMPPHPRLAAAQVILVRALLAALAQAPYEHPLVRWGQALHDRFLLPYWLWRDFEDVLSFLAGRGQVLDPDAFWPFLDLRCPQVGELRAGEVVLALRNAIEPWHVLGEELGSSGTTRYVDSSVERVELRVTGFVPERYSVLVNGYTLPLRTTPESGTVVGGIRFKAWAPAHSLHGHLGVHHPLRIELLDTWGKRSAGAFAYHVWHPEGRAFDTPPLTRFEAAARRSQRFTRAAPSSWPVRATPVPAHPDAPYTLDLRRLPLDHPIPGPWEEETAAKPFPLGAKS